MKMRGINVGNSARSRKRMMNEPSHQQVERQVVPLFWRRWISAPQSRPPFGFQAIFERPRVGRANDVTARAFRILRDEATFRDEYRIRRGIDMTHERSIAVECRCIRTGRAGLETNAIKRRQIAWAIGTNVHA